MITAIVKQLINCTLVYYYNDCSLWLMFSLKAAKGLCLNLLSFKTLPNLSLSCFSIHLTPLLFLALGRFFGFLLMNFCVGTMLMLLFFVDISVFPSVCSTASSRAVNRSSIFGFNCSLAFLLILLSVDLETLLVLLVWIFVRKLSRLDSSLSRLVCLCPWRNARGSSAIVLFVFGVSESDEADAAVAEDDDFA